MWGPLLKTFVEGGDALEQHPSVLETARTLWELKELDLAAREALDLRVRKELLMRPEC